MPLPRRFLERRQYVEIPIAINVSEEGIVVSPWISLKCEKPGIFDAAHVTRKLYTLTTTHPEWRDLVWDPDITF